MTEQRPHDQQPQPSEQFDFIFKDGEQPQAYLNRLKQAFSDPVQHQWFDLLFQIAKNRSGETEPSLSHDNATELLSTINQAQHSFERQLATIYQLEKADHFARMTGRKRVDSLSPTSALIRQTSMRILASISQVFFAGGIKVNLAEQADRYAKNSQAYQTLNNTIQALTKLKKSDLATVSTDELNQVIEQLETTAPVLNIPEEIVSQVKSAARQ